MNAAERRQCIQRVLMQAQTPVSASVLAARCGVSRQIIVGDIALLRASGYSVLATPRGYILESESTATAFVEQRVVCRHTDERLLEELYCVVDLGGGVVDVTVEHSVYGQISAPLRIFSRYEADAFAGNLEASGAKPLCDLTDGLHLHLLRAPDRETLDRVLDGLRARKLLYADAAQEEDSAE